MSMAIDLSNRRTCISKESFNWPYLTLDPYQTGPHPVQEVPEWRSPTLPYPRLERDHRAHAPWRCLLLPLSPCLPHWRAGQTGKMTLASMGIHSYFFFFVLNFMDLWLDSDFLTDDSDLNRLVCLLCSDFHCFSQRFWLRLFLYSYYCISLDFPFHKPTDCYK